MFAQIEGGFIAVQCPYAELPFQSAFLGARAQRLANLLSDQGDSFFCAAGVKTPARCVSTVLFLSAKGPASLVEIARGLQEQHQLISHRMEKLRKLSLVERNSDPHDERRRVYHLTDAGKAEIALIEERSRLAAAVFEDLNSELGFDLAEKLDVAFAALSERSIGQRNLEE